MSNSYYLSNVGKSRVNPRDSDTPTVAKPHGPPEVNGIEHEIADSHVELICEGEVLLGPHKVPLPTANVAEEFSNKEVCTTVPALSIEESCSVAVVVFVVVVLLCFLFVSLQCEKPVISVPLLLLQGISDWPYIVCCVSIFKIIESTKIYTTCTMNYVL